MTYSNKEGGYFKQFINANSHYVYSLNTDLVVLRKSNGKRDINMALYAYDKNSLTQKHSVQLRGKDNQKRSELLKGKVYLKTIVQEELVFVFWEETEKKTVSVFAESFDYNLRQVEKLKKVYSYDGKYKTGAIVLNALEDNTDILIGHEFSDERGGEIKFEYVLFDSGLSKLAAKELEYSFSRVGKNYSGISSKYNLGKDGNLYIQTDVVLSKDDKKNLEKGESSSYTKFTVVNLEDGDYKTLDVRFEDKNVLNFNYTIGDGEVRLYGFYNDLTIDNKKRSTNGIFHTTLNSNSLEISKPVFSEFDKRTLDKLFKEDKEDRKKSKAFTRKGKARKDAVDNVSLQDNYVIETARILDDGNIVLFGTKMRNYTVTVCTTDSKGVTTCREVPYCDKGNVTLFNLNKDGELTWSSNIDRQITYGRHNRYDLRVLKKENKAFVIYGSRYEVEAEKKSRGSQKSKSDVRDKFEYAIFDLDGGESEKNEFVVNKPQVEKEERKYVNPFSISVFNDEYYLNSVKVTRNVGKTIAGCAASIVCFPVIYFVAIHPAFREGEGYLGKLEIID
jgi:hypothetical protein